MVPHLVLQVLTQEEIGRIHDAMLKVLSRTGAWSRKRQILEALASYGARIDPSAQRAFFPAALIERFWPKSAVRSFSGDGPAVRSEVSDLSWNVPLPGNRPN